MNSSIHLVFLANCHILNVFILILISMQNVNEEIKKKIKKFFYVYHIFIEKGSFMNFMNSNIVFFYFMYLLLLNHVM
jgi:hypothetical protein